MSSNKMKMIIAIVRDANVDDILTALLNAEFRVTRIASSGGFFRRGNATLMMGVKEERLEEALTIIRKLSKPTLDLAVKHATVFVLDIDHFEQV